MRSLLILSLLATPAAAWQAPIDASQTGTTNVTPGTTTSFVSGGSRATSASDDFNRADGSDLGSDWLETGGDMGIIANTGYDTVYGASYMTHTSLSDDYATSKQVIDFLPQVGSAGIGYVALICALDPVGGRSLFIKVQDNTSDGIYDRVFFYSAYNGSPWNSSYYYDLAVPIDSGRMQVTFEDAGDKAVLDIDRDLDGTWDEQFTCDGILAAGMPLGTNFAIGSFRSAAFDNWAVNDGDEPGVAYCFGDLGVGTPCPCGNDNDGSVPGSGCANGVFASGAQLVGSGKASLSADTLVLATSFLEPNNSGLYFQADNDLSPGILWGDGLQCAGGQLKRLGVRFSNANGYSDTSGYAYTISAKAGNILAGDTKRYQCWYRNTLLSPCGAEFNASNGYAVTWTP